MYVYHLVLMARVDRSDDVLVALKDGACPVEDFVSQRDQGLFVASASLFIVAFTIAE